jgi:hypothetical protein
VAGERLFVVEGGLVVVVKEVARFDVDLVDPNHR